MINESMFTSTTAEWATPQAFFDELNAEFNFTLDPCATSENAKCARYFTKEDDGLAQSWSGERVFCNPPYGRDINKWVEKAYNEAVCGGAHACRYAYPRPHGHAIFSRLYIRKARNPFYTRSVALQRKQNRRTVSVNGCRYASNKGKQ